MTEQPMPGIKQINGHDYIKIQDLAKDWHTTTSSILATGKPQQVPAQYRRTIDGRTWCDVEGLRYRLNSMKRGGKIREQLRQLVDRFPDPSFTLTGPLMETVYEKNGGTTTIYHSTFQNIDAPSSEELQAALENRQIIYRYKNNRIQVLAQTLSNYLDTRTSSLLAVNKKQGVPAKFIHRAWKRTWVDLGGLKQRVQHTEHGSALLKGLKQVIQYLDGGGKPFDQLVKTMKQSKPAKPEQKKQTKPGMKRNPIDVCNVAVEANKRAVHNTERINKLTAHIQHIDRQATEAAVNQTLLGELHTRLGRVATQADSLESRAEGLDSRVSVLEDTSKWLGWSVATMIGLRLLGLTLRWLRRK